jgi:hypothetical protein
LFLFAFSLKQDMFQHGNDKHDSQPISKHETHDDEQDKAVSLESLNGPMPDKNGDHQDNCFVLHEATLKTKDRNEISPPSQSDFEENDQNSAHPQVTRDEDQQQQQQQSQTQLQPHPHPHLHHDNSRNNNDDVDKLCDTTMHDQSNHTNTSKATVSVHSIQFCSFYTSFLVVVSTQHPFSVIFLLYYLSHMMSGQQSDFNGWVCHICACVNQVTLSVCGTCCDGSRPQGIVVPSPSSHDGVDPELRSSDMCVLKALGACIFPSCFLKPIL